MCWGVGASSALAIAGIGITCYLAYKKEHPALWLTLGYFSLMEVLQALTYSVINNCSSPSNQIFTLLGYLHIAFQPFFIQAISMYFIPNSIRQKIMIPVYSICFFVAVMMIIQLYPLAWAGSCHIGDFLCGTQLCSVSGNWHLAWELPINGLATFMGYFSHYGVIYMITAFGLPILYGSWKLTTYHFLVGPFLAGLLTNNANEQPAIWCLFSIGIILIIVITPLRKSLFVNHWFLWPKSKKK